jgi:hypothetical protein
MPARGRLGVEQDGRQCLLGPGSLAIWYQDLTCAHWSSGRRRVPVIRYFLVDDQYTCPEWANIGPSGAMAEALMFIGSC